MKKRKLLSLILCFAMLAALFTPFSATAAGGVSIAYDKDSEILTINSDKIQTAALVHAAYDDSGKLTDLRTENIALPYSTSRAMFPGAENKIMVWDSIDGMNSLCDPYTLTVEKEPAPEWKDGISVCAPYDYVYGTAYEQFSTDINRQHFKMAGKDYTDGFVLQNNSSSYDAEAMFNLDDRYDAVKFKYGHVDGTYNRNVTLNIYLDRKLVQSVPLSYDTGVSEIEINTAGAMGMRFVIENIGSGYGFTEFQFLSKSRPEKQPYKGNWMSEFPPYELTYTTLCDRTKYETINMSGYEYTNGFTMSNYSSSYDAEAIFNLQGRCTNLTFTAGHVDGSYYRNVTLDVYLDMELAYEIPLYYYDVAREHSISLLNKNGEPAHQMKFMINDIGSAYGFADGTFSFTEDKRVPTEGNWTNVFAPHEYSHATAYSSEQNQWATMSGEQYTDGFVMSGSGDGEAIFNLEGKCTDLTFTVGHIDGTYHYNRTLIVYLDTIPVEKIPLYYDDVAREHTISLINPQTKEPAQQMKLAIEDLYYEGWGFFRGKFNYTAEPSSPPNDNNWTKVFSPYEYSHAQIYKDGGIDGEGNYDKFTMSGRQYTDGFVMSGSGDGEAVFNLEGKCTNLTFTVGHIDGTSHYNRTLNVYIDGVLDEKRSIDLRYDDIAREHTISLLNADGKPASTLKLVIENMYYDSWGFANGRFDYTEPPAAPDLNSTWLTDCPPYDTTKNNVTIYSANDEDESTFKMSGYDIDDGMVTKNSGSMTALFNIENKYKELKVMIGHIDGTSHYNRTLNVYIDNALMNSYTLYYDRAAQEYTIPLLNSSGQPGSILKLEIQSLYYDGWGFAYGRFE